MAPSSCGSRHLQLHPLHMVEGVEVLVVQRHSQHDLQGGQGGGCAQSDDRWQARAT